MICEIFTLHSCQILTLYYNTFTVPEAHKFKQNKTRTTDAVDEHIQVGTNLKILN